MDYKWPLSVPQFSWLDKMKFAKFILTNDRWTQGDVVSKFEAEMAKYVGCNHAVFTSSGSTANTLLAMYLKDNRSLERNTIVFPSTTWITSISPFLREGFEAEFIDISLSDFCMDLDKLEDYLINNHQNVACIFVTSLIGFTPDISRLQEIQDSYNVRIMMDNCENTLGRYDNENVSSYFTSTTSTYFGHQIQSVEGGFVFTNSEKEYEYFLMARNHGMIRNLPEDRIESYRNLMVDGRFDFNMLGNNFRNTNLHAYVGLLDLKRAEQYFMFRRKAYDLLVEHLYDFLILPLETNGKSENAPFCFPIILREKYKNHLDSIKKLCEDLGIETRPIISGNLLRQRCLRRKDYASFENSEYVHENGFYIGLHGSTELSEVNTLCDLIKIILFEKRLCLKR